MNPKIIGLSKQSVILNQGTPILIRVSSGKKPANLEKLAGLLKHYKKKYTSVELQHMSKEWWASVSN